jgi:hypothetical protein
VAKKKKRSGAGKDAQKVSPPAPAGARPWTAEEMEAARPLPMPETEASGVPHVGEGNVKPAGRPDSE